MKQLCALIAALSLLCFALPAFAEESAGAPVVYMTADISPEGLMAVYEALGREAAGENVAVKISTGETGSNYLRPELIGEFVQAVDGTIVECNTAYGGQRASTAMHYQLAEDHGYTAIADVDIMDGNGSMTLNVEGGTVLTLADLSMDTAAQKVTRAGKAIALTGREYALLEYLMRNQGAVLSRERIEQNIFNYDYEGASNMVDVYIRYLRKKIDEGFSPKLIHTVRGAGYVLREEA